MHQWLPRSSSPSLASSEPTRRLGGTRPAQALASLLDLAGAVESDFATLELKAAERSHWCLARLVVASARRATWAVAALPGDKRSSRIAWQAPECMPSWGFGYLFLSLPVPAPEKLDPHQHHHHCSY